MKQRELHKRYIKDTEKEARVKDVRALLCHLGKGIRRILEIEEYKIYIKTRVLKHLYDKRTAQDYDFMLASLLAIIRFPDRIYHNKPDRRGEFAFYKIINNRGILCTIEKNEADSSFDIVTVFTSKNFDNYLKDFRIINPAETEN